MLRDQLRGSHHNLDDDGWERVVTVVVGIGQILDLCQAEPIGFPYRLNGRCDRKRGVKDDSPVFVKDGDAIS